MTLTAEQIRDIIFEMGGTPPQALEEAVKDKNGYSELPPHRYSAVSECYFGPGSRHMLVDSLQSRNIKKVLIITDKGLVKSGMIDEFREALAEDSIQSAVFSDVEPNPTTETVEAGVAALHRCRPDCLLAIGGGSPIDTAKAINILAFNGGKISDYEGVNRSQERGLPLAALPTTAGTGSETTDFYVITDKVRHSKMVMVDHHCQVKIAAIDPELMMGMPPHLTAATGMDAMTHAVEACLSVRSNPMTDRDATFAIREIREALPAVFQDGKNVNGRSRMAYAQFSAGQSFANAGLGLVHAMAHS